jgi:hypothetical protein
LQVYESRGKHSLLLSGAPILKLHCLLADTL